MIIELTKDYKKPNGNVIKKGTRISVTTGHPYKDFAVVQKDGKIDKERELEAMKSKAERDDKRAAMDKGPYPVKEKKNKDK